MRSYDLPRRPGRVLIDIASNVVLNPWRQIQIERRIFAQAQKSSYCYLRHAAQYFLLSRALLGTAHVQKRGVADQILDRAVLSFITTIFTINTINLLELRISDTLRQVVVFP